MEKAERVFAILGLAWVISISFGWIFPRAWETCHTQFEMLWSSLLGAGSKLGVVGFAASMSMMLLAFVAASVIVWGIKKARG